MDVQVDICARYNPSEVYLWGKNGLDIRSRTLIFYRQNVISSSHIFTLHHSHRTVTDNLKTYGTVTPLATAVAGVGAINRKSFSRIWTAAKREWCTWLQVTNPAENSSRCQAFGSFPNIYVYPVCPKVQKKTERESHPSLGRSLMLWHTVVFPFILTMLQRDHPSIFSRLQQHISNEAPYVFYGFRIQSMMYSF